MKKRYFKGEKLIEKLGFEIRVKYTIYNIYCKVRNNVYCLLKLNGNRCDVTLEISGEDDTEFAQYDLGLIKVDEIKEKINNKLVEIGLNENI